MRIIALCPDARCGWATWDGKHHQSGTKVFDRVPDQELGAELLRFRTWLDHVCELIRPAVIACREPRDLPTGTDMDLCVGMCMHAQELAAAHASVHTAISAEQVHARQRPGEGVTDRSHARALLILAHARRQGRPQNETEEW